MARNKLLIILSSLFLVTALAGCNKEEHTHSYTESITTEPTHTQAGVKTFTCSCGDSYFHELPALGHDNVTVYSKDENQHWKQCSCGEILEAKANHEFGEIISSDASCTQEGTLKQVCKICGYEKILESKGYSHLYTEIVDEACLKETNGTNKTYYKSCMLCGDKSTETFTIDTSKKYKVVGDYVEKTKEELLNEYVPADTNPFILAMVDTLLQQLIGTGQIKFRRYSFEYLATYEDKEMVLSSALTIPFNDETPVIHGVNIDHHPTLTDASEAPSNGFDIYGIAVIAGLAVVEPDLIGFGSTVNLPADYHCRHLSDINSLEALDAAYDLIKDEVNIDCAGNKIYNTGYSQGGYNALSFMRYFEEELDTQTKEKFNLRATFAGSGAYDLKTMIFDSLNKDDFQYPEYILMGIITAKYFHPELFDDVEIDDFLTDYGKQFIEPILNKNDAQLQALKLQTNDQGELIYKTPHDFFDEKFFNPDEKLQKILDEYCEGENLLDGKWTPAGELMLLYSKDDEMVSPNCSIKAVEMWKDLENFSYDASSGYSHRDYGTQYYLETVLSLLGYIGEDIDII